MTGRAALLAGGLGLALLAAPGCASTRLTGAWADPATAKAGELDKVLVVSTAESPEMRRAYEDRMAARLREEGVDAVQGYLATTSEEQATPEQLRQVAEQGDYDGVLVARFAGTRTVAREEPATYPWDGMSPWGLYDAWAFGPTEATVLGEEAAMETRVFRRSDGHETLAWAGRTETADPRDQRAIIDGSVDQVVKALEKEGLV